MLLMRHGTSSTSHKWQNSPAHVAAVFRMSPAEIGTCRLHPLPRTVWYGVGARHQHHPSSSGAEPVFGVMDSEIQCMQRYGSVICVLSLSD